MDSVFTFSQPPAIHTWKQLLVAFPGYFRTRVDNHADEAFRSSASREQNARSKRSTIDTERGFAVSVPLGRVCPGECKFWRLACCFDRSTFPLGLCKDFIEAVVSQEISNGKKMVRTSCRSTSGVHCFQPAAGACRLMSCCVETARNRAAKAYFNLTRATSDAVNSYQLSLLPIGASRCSFSMFPRRHHRRLLPIGALARYTWTSSRAPTP